MFKGVLIFSVLLFNFYVTFAQTQIAGKVTELSTNTPLEGVSIFIEGTTIGTISDLEGKFVLKCAEGNYTLIAKYVSYKDEITKNVKVINDQTTYLNLTLQDEAVNMKEAVVKAKVIKGDATYINIERKNAAIVGDGVSSEQFRKTPDRSVGDVLKRITGTSIQEGKFAIIRGMNDRYNIAYLNGAPLPSTESDRKAFSFNIIPSSLIDNVMIYKSPSPDANGDFAGGIIYITTKSIPENKTSSLSLSVGGNTITTFKKYQDFRRSKTDVFGFDNGLRSLPTQEVFREGKFTPNEYANFTKEFNNDYNLYDRRALPATSLLYTWGNSYTIKKNVLGILGSVSYNNTNKFTKVVQTKYRYDDNTVDQKLTDKQSNANINAGAVLNIGYKIGTKNIFGFKNLFNQTAENTTTLRSGLISNDNSFYGRSYSTIYNQSSILSSQLTGDHLLDYHKIKVNWIFNSGIIKRATPDYRVVNYAGEEEPYTLSLNNNLFSTSTGRFFSNLKENIYSFTYNAVLPYKFKNIKGDLKAGGFNQWRKREFQSRFFSYYGANGLTGNMNDILGENNISSTGVYMKEQSVPARDNYNASSILNAGYVMSDFRLFSVIRVSTGLRVESYQQSITTANDIFLPLTIDTTVTDWLPSLNLTYSPNKKSNIRLSAGKSVNRPEYREISNFAFFNFNLNSNIKGNVNLKRAVVYNYEIRYELFPKLSEVISIGFFYKKILLPIEMSLDVTQTSIRLFGYDNQEKADNYGVEIEFKKDLGFITEKIKNLLFFSNIALIKSNITFNNLAASGNKRPLQGQSPYVVNGGLTYASAEKGWNFSLSANKTGRRIAFVGAPKLAKYGLDIYENPRTIIDFQVAKQFKKFDIKFTLGDLLAQDLVFYQDIDDNKKYIAEKDNSIFNYNMGRTVSLSFNYKFK